MGKYRILSLDGGGSWALIQVMALKALCSGSTSGHEVLRDFDLVATNSGGSITVGGLIENKTLDDLLDGYFLSEACRKKIFVSASFFRDPGNKTFRAVFGVGAKYDASRKLAGLQELLPGYGGIQVTDLPERIGRGVGRKPELLICGFNYDTKRSAFFRSNLRSLAASSAPPIAATLAEAIHASTNAPVNYFDAPAEIGERRYWDGAIAGYNNPVLAGVTEALANGVHASDIEVLSIGTATVLLPIATGAPDEDPNLVQSRTRPTIVHDVGELAGSILDDPPDVATFITHVMLGQPLPSPSRPPPLTGSIVRMNPLIRPVRSSASTVWEPPAGLTSKEFKALVNLDMDAVEQDDVNRIKQLAELWLSDAVPNQPIRANSETFQCEIGHATFSAAKATWESLAGGRGGTGDGAPVA